jgi:hypothetical protein
VAIHNPATCLSNPKPASGFEQPKYSSGEFQSHDAGVRWWMVVPTPVFFIVLAKTKKKLNKSKDTYL